MQREIWIPEFPQRIVSLVPSQTEFLIEIGLGERLVGRTLFCIHPKESIQNIPQVGGTKKLRLDAIRALNPDLIIGNKEENLQEEIESLAKEFPVWMSDIVEMDDALKMMKELGSIVQLEPSSQSLISEIESVISRIQNCNYSFKGKRVVYAIWKDPWMFAGKDTFIHKLLELAGFTNLITESRYPEISPESIRQLNPDFILLSSEPFPFDGKHFQSALELFPEQKPVLVDGEMFSWYGSRMRHLSAYLEELDIQLKT